MRKQEAGITKITFWHMLRDVLVTSINKGQFPLALTGLIILVLLLKMPSNDVSKLAFEILDDLKIERMVGYLLALLLLIGWFIHARWQRRIISEEMNRIAEERNKLQERQAGKALRSTNGKRSTHFNQENEKK